MSTIYISKTHKELAERLARNATSVANKSIFSSYMQLMVFAAMIGYSKKKFVEVEAKNRGAEIYEEVFQRHKLDGLVFLMALDEMKDGDILRDSRDAECWRVIEGYAEGGFQEIQQWLLDQPGDIDGVETLLARMAEEASERVRSSTASLEPDIDF